MKTCNVSELSTFYPDLQPSNERVALEQRLDFCRRAVLARIEDLDDASATRHPLPATNLSVAGIVKHLACAEDRWFVGKMLGEPLPEPWTSIPAAEQQSWPFESAVNDTVRDLAKLYTTACERSRAITAEFASLDAVAAAVSFNRAPVTLRWLLVHMIDETAWHLGHLDLLLDALGVVNPA